MTFDWKNIGNADCELMVRWNLFEWLIAQRPTKQTKILRNC